MIVIMYYFSHKIQGSRKECIFKKKQKNTMSHLYQLIKLYFWFELWGDLNAIEEMNTRHGSNAVNPLFSTAGFPFNMLSREQCHRLTLGILLRCGSGSIWRRTEHHIIVTLHSTRSFFLIHTRRRSVWNQMSFFQSHYSIIDIAGSH